MEKEKIVERFPAPSIPLVRWYFKGQADLEPRVAIVTRSAKGGVLTLTVFGADNPTPTTVDGVRHRDDEFHTKFPMHKNESGFWDYLPGQDPRPKEAATQPCDERPQSDEKPQHQKR